MLTTLRDRVRERGLRRQNVLPTNDSPGSTPRSGSRDDGKESILIKVEGRGGKVEETAAQKVDRVRNEEEGAANLAAQTDLKDAEKRFFFVSACCLGMIFLMSLLGQLLVHFTINNVDTSSELIDFAGRQRMIAQKMSRIAIALQLKEELRGLQAIGGGAAHGSVDSNELFGSDIKMRVELHDTVQRMRDGHERVVRDPHLTVELSAEMERARSAFEELVTSAEIFEYRSSIEAAARMYNASKVYTPLMDLAVQHMQENHDYVLDSALQELLLITWLLLVMVLVCVLVEGFKVFKPMMQKLAVFSDVAMKAQMTVNNTKSELANKSNVAALFDTAAAPIFALNQAQEITQWNPKIADITAIPEDEAIGMKLSDFVEKNGHKALAEALVKVHAGEEVGLLEVQVTGKSKAPRILLVSASPWRDSSGKSEDVMGLFCIAQDFTEHKAMERARETFLASFSHEIRTPLNGVLGMLQVLCEFDLPAQALTYLRQACTSGNLLLNLINDILDLSKIDAGQLEIDEQAFNVATTVKDAVAIVRPLATKKGLSLIHHIASDVPATGLGDPMRLRQIILNLLSNAIKFTMQGAVTLRVTLHDVRDGKYMLGLEVEDTGVGMSPEDLAGLFKIFGKGKQTKVQNSSGCGLGLMISKKLAMLMGGDITVTSEMGRGSRFMVTILVDRFSGKISGGSDGSTNSHTGDSSSHPSAHSTAGSGSNSHSKGTNSTRAKFDLTASLGLGDGTVAAGMSSAKYKKALAKCGDAHLLCAEDNLFNVEVLRAFVSGSKMRMTTVEDGKQALDEYTSNPDKYAVILMDCQMPVMDGFEATRQIRAWERINADVLRRPAVPIVALTAYAMSLDRQKAFDSGMDSFLTKPVSKFALIHTIAEYVASGKDTQGKDQKSSRSSKSRQSQRKKTKKTKKTTKKQKRRGVDFDESTETSSRGRSRSSRSSSKKKEQRFRRRDKKKAEDSAARLEMLQTAVLPRDVVLGAQDGTHSVGRSGSIASTRAPTEAGGAASVDGLTDRDGTASLSTDAVAVREANTASSQPWQDSPVVDQKAGLIQFGGSQRSHFQVLRMFDEKFLPDCRKDIKRHAKAKNYPELSKAIHLLKGASGFAVVVRIFKLSVHLQRIVPASANPVLAADEEDTIARLLRSLERECDSFHDHFSTLLDSDNGGGSQSMSAPVEAPSLKTPDERRLDGVRVLYAEDNAFCVKVIKTYLKSCNASVTSARDGTDVVSKLVSGRQRYDCVLMDCQMPVMDGFQALKVIRHWESEQRREGDDRIPIIGITAYAGHRDSCIQGGMDSFLTKPVARPVLIRTIAACLGKREGDDEDEDDGAGLTDASYAVSESSAAVATDATGAEEVKPFGEDCPINMHEGTANFGSEEQYLELLQQFQGEFVPSAVSAIEAARKARDPEALSKALHRLKGSAGYVGASKLFSMCASAREVVGAKNSRWRDISRTVETVLSELERVQRFLDRNDKVRAFFAGGSIAPGAKGSPPASTRRRAVSDAAPSSGGSSASDDDDDDSADYGSSASSRTSASASVDDV